jgi:hypothetical protein
VDDPSPCSVVALAFGAYRFKVRSQINKEVGPVGRTPVSVPAELDLFEAFRGFIRVGYGTKGVKLGRNGSCCAVLAQLQRMRGASSGMTCMVYGTGKLKSRRHGAQRTQIEAARMWCASLGQGARHHGELLAAG